MMQQLVEYLARHNPLPTLFSGSGVTIAGASLSWLDTISWVVGVSAGLMAFAVGAFTIAVAIETRKVRLKEQRALDRAEKREKFHEQTNLGSE